MQSQKHVSLKQQKNLIILAQSLSINCYNFTKVMLENQMKRNYLKIMQSHFQYEKIIMPRNICAKVFDNQWFFFCYDCQVFPNSCQCVQCFSKTNHQGHNFKKQLAEGGTCDCGDDQKWKVQSTCSDHKNQNVTIQVDEQKTKTFIKQMKYCFLVYLLLKEQNLNEANKLFYAIIQFLFAFNEKSMISNQMTFRLLKQELNQQHFQQFQELRTQKMTILNLIFLFCSKIKSNQEDKIIQLLQLLQSRKQCRIFITQNYNLSINRMPSILMSSVQGLFHQLLTSYKVVEKLIDQDRLPPIVIRNFTQLNSPQQVSQLFFVLYNIFDDLNLLKFDVNRKYFRHLFLNSNIVYLSGYEDFIVHKPILGQVVQAQIKFYVIQFIYLKNLKAILTHIKDQQQILIKCLKQLIAYFKEKLAKKHDYSVILAKQRTFLVLIYYLTKGDIKKAAQKQFMSNIGMTQQVIYYLYQKVFNPFLYYSMCLSDFNLAMVFGQFYQLIFGDAQRILISLDFQILNFCMLAANQQTKLIIRKQNKNLMILLYNQIDFSRKQNKLEQKINQLKIQPTLHGLLFQNIITNHSSLTVKAHLDMITRQQSYKLYGQLLKTFKSIKIEEFSKITSIFLTSANPYLQSFIQQFCKVDHFKIYLLNEKQHLFNPINFSTLISMRGCQALDPYLQANFKQLGYGNNNFIQLKQNQQIFNSFTENFFNQDHFVIAVKFVQAFIQDLDQFPEKEQIFGCLLLWLQQMIRQYKIYRSQPVEKLFQFLRSKQNIFKKLNNLIQKEIISFTSAQQNKKEADLKVDQKNKYKNELKLKRIEQMKQKQNKFLQSLKLSSKQQQNLNMEQKPICMICKVSDEEEPLSLLCFRQQSNIFSNAYLGSSFPVQFITTCNHFAHFLCIAQRYDEEQEIRCQFCKTTTNIQLIVNLKQQTKSENQQKMNQIQAKLQMNQKQKMVQTIAFEVLYGLFVNYDFFVNSLAPVCCSLLKQLSNASINLQVIIKHLQNQRSKSELTEIKQNNWDVLRATVKQIVFYVQFRTFSGKFLEYDIECGSISLRQNLSFMLQGIKNFYQLSTLKTKKIVPLQPLKIRRLEKNLKDLIKQLGKCPNCLKVTNQVGLCLLCQFKSCLGCKVENLIAHTNKYHCGKSIFIRADVGTPIYVSSNRAGHRSPIYFNDLHLPFGQSDEDTKKKQQFNLDMNNYEKLQADLVRHHVEQEMRYIEINQGVKLIGIY